MGEGEGEVMGKSWGSYRPEVELRSDLGWGWGGGPEEYLLVRAVEGLKMAG